MGNLTRRTETLRVLAELPPSPVAGPGEVMKLVGTGRLYGKGIGYVAAHVLAAACLDPHIRLWTRDRRLAAVAAELNVAYLPPEG